jgi:FKBP-type peptidyl-prolyl cis-trans isomerase SlyD
MTGTRLARFFDSTSPTKLMNEQAVSRDKVVSITYEIRNERGDTVERSDLPMSYVHGSDRAPYEKVERALEGCKPGDSVEVTLTPEESFGPHRPELTYSDEIENVPPEYRRLGAEAMFQNEAGETMTMIVTRIEDGKITLDGNHPLAGQAVTFVVKVEGVRDATQAERASGEPMDAAPSVH